MSKEASRRIASGPSASTRNTSLLCSFAALGKRMNLPQTSILALSGPIHIPETDGGRAWFTSFDENWDLIEPSPNETRRLHSLRVTRAKLSRLLDNLETRCGWNRGQINLLGFSQGGTAALDLALNSCGANKLGGVVSRLTRAVQVHIYTFDVGYCASLGRRGSWGCKKRRKKTCKWAGEESFHPDLKGREPTHVKFEKPLEFERNLL